MSRGSLALIRQSKRFYISTFRRGARFLVISAVINFLLIVAIGFAYFSQGEHDFYTTSGVMPPDLLKALDEPNYSSTPLLPNDPENDDDLRIIPQ